MARRKSSSGGSWELPKIYGDFELVQRLGGGTLGELFLARRLEDDRPCHVRIFPPQFSARMPRVLEEAKAVGKLEHPGIRPLYDMGREGSTYFVAMQATEAPSLQDWFDDDESPLDPGHAIEALAAVARALHTAHEAGIIHGHLRPENVLVAVTDDGAEAMVENFGIEKLRTASMLVASGSIDRARFLSPEQARESERFDARSDVYALGVMLYRVVCGRYHVEGLTIHEILRRISEGDYIAPSSRVRDIDPDVAAVIERCLALDPDDRYSTARALASDLDALAAGDRPRARDMRPLKKRGTRRHLKGKGRLKVWAAATVLVLGGGLVAVWAAGALRPGTAPARRPGAKRSPGGGDGTTREGPGGRTESDTSGAQKTDDAGQAERTAAAADAAVADVQALLEAGNPADAVAACTRFLVDHPGHADLLALRGQAKAALGNAESALTDLNAARTAAGGESEDSERARARAAWALFCERATTGPVDPTRIDPQIWAYLGEALAHVDELPSPVDPAPGVERLLQIDVGALDAYARRCEELLPEGLLRDFFRQAERQPHDPVGDPLPVFERAAKRWPQWAAPQAHLACRLRTQGRSEDAAAAMARARELDPQHPAVAFVQAVFDLLDGKPGAIQRGADAWQARRGATFRQRRNYYLALRERMRDAGAHTKAALVALRYVRDAPEEDLIAIARWVYADTHRGVASDVQAFVSGPAPADARGRRLQQLMRALLTPKAAVTADDVAAVLADDPLGEAAAVLSVIVRQARRAAMQPHLAALQPWTGVPPRMSNTYLGLAGRARERGNLENVHRYVGSAIQYTSHPAVIRAGMRLYGRAVLELGDEKERRRFQGYLDAYIQNRAPGVHLNALLWRARVFEARGDAAAARADLDAAVALHPPGPGALLSRARFALRQGDLDQARADAEAAIAAHPDAGHAYLVRGFVHHLAGDVTAAHADYHTADEIGPSARTVHVMAAYAAIQEGADEAHILAHLRGATNLPRGRAGRIVWAWWHAKNGRHAEAVDKLAEAATLKRDEYEYDLPLGKILVEPFALRDEEQTTVVEVLLRLAETGFADRERPVAERALRGAAALVKPGDGHFQYLWARLYAADGHLTVQVLDALERAAKAGYRPAGGFGTEPEFRPLQNLGRFQKLREQMR